MQRRLANAATAEAAYREALDIWQTVPSADAAVAATLVDLAELREAAGDAVDARSLYGQAVAVSLRLGDRRGAIVPASRIVALARSAGASDPSHLPWSLNTLAELHRESGDLEAARPLYEEALELAGIVERNGGGLTATILNNLGLLHSNSGERAAARECFQRRFLARADGDAALPMALNNLADSLLASGELAAAKPLLDESIELRRRTFGDNAPQVAVASHNLGRYALAAGKYGDARGYSRAR